MLTHQRPAAAAALNVISVAAEATAGVEAPAEDTGKGRAKATAKSLANRTLQLLLKPPMHLKVLVERLSADVGQRLLAFTAILEERAVTVHRADLLFYKRYIDDGCGVWVGSEADLLSFLNSLFTSSGLEITHEYSTRLLVFLDMELFRHSKRLVTRCYQKPTNAYLYLPFRSEHPPHVFVGFIRGELIRYVKRCFLFDDFCTMAALFSTRLRARGYPAAVVRKSYRCVSFRIARREQYLNHSLHVPGTRDGDTTHDAPRRIALVMDFSSQNMQSGISILFRKNLGWLPRHFDDVEFTTGWRASSKLGRELVTYRFSNSDSVPTGSSQESPSTLSTAALSSAALQHFLASPILTFIFSSRNPPGI